ncbi:Ovochymase-1 [Paragonimus heterotremus]|uniref:Ovochymase-1 n=1 Tax=Paragonimus heterotremus TaxID=100268 RepID=A0A8J4T5K6_9TREM|nr:Ovochymase-1 [Paragonimus heterotremus]
MFDFVSIDDYNSDTPYYFCGDTPPSFPTVISSSVAVVTFTSDAGHGGRGFKLVYRTQQKPLNDSHECGLAPSLPKRRHKRLIGGSPVTLGQWPWIVSLWEKNNFQCGATLLNSNWLLTAAHCIPKKINLAEWRAVLGDYLLTWEDDHEQSVRFSSVHIHPNYGQKAHFDNDIALLRLNITAQFQRTIRPVCLLHINTTRSMEQRLISRANCYVAGWGRTESKVLSEELRHMQLNILNLTTCNKTKAYNGGLTSSMLCAGYMKGERDSCQGDSGGPLMCQDETDKRWYQIGVVSFGKECAGKPTLC